MLRWSVAYGTEIFFGGGQGGGGHVVRCLLQPLPHWWSGLFIISVIHGCFMLFVSSWALHSPTSRNSLFHALLLPVCWYTVVLVYNPVLLPPVFSEFHVSWLCRAQPFRNATLHPPFIQVLFSIVIGDTFFTGGAYKVTIAVTVPRVLKELQHVLLPNTCSICDIRL